jgi:hypothetical protein
MLDKSLDEKKGDDMSNQSPQPNFPQEKIRQVLLAKFEENKKAIIGLSDEELSNVSGAGKMGWNILSGVAMTLTVPAILSGFSKPPTKAG